MTPPAMRGALRRVASPWAWIAIALLGGPALVAPGCGSSPEAVSAGAGGGGGSTSSALGGLGGEGCAPETELCNGVDDDCDGEVDEGCACIEGDTQPCWTGPPTSSASARAPRVPRAAM